MGRWQRRSATPFVLSFAVAAAVASLFSRTAVDDYTSFVASSRSPRIYRDVALRAGQDDFLKQVEELSKDPSKLQQVQKEMEKVLEGMTPEQRQQLEKMQEQQQKGIEALKADPEMKDFFEDVEKNGMSAMQKYMDNERILQKFSKAMGGPESLQGLVPGPAAGGAAAAGAPVTFKPGDQVWITGLAKAPELNGKKAMVVPPTAEEKENLAGTNRLIVRLLDTGDQFAVKPDNLRTDDQWADEQISQDLDSVAMFNPALQGKAQQIRESGKLDALLDDPELAPIFKDIEANGMAALDKYWNDEKLMAKISKAMGTMPPKK